VFNILLVYIVIKVLHNIKSKMTYTIDHKIKSKMTYNNSSIRT